MKKFSFFKAVESLVSLCKDLGYETEFRSNMLFIYAQDGCFIGSTIIERVSCPLTCYVSSTVEGRVYLCVYSD